MNVIAAVDKNWAIGLKNKLLVRIPADLRYFQKLTTGKTVIMGRKTLESFPGQRPLKDRRNIVITRKSRNIEGTEVVHSVEEALEAIKDLATEDIFVIGGQSIYEQMLPYCDTAYITRINFAFEADTYFPNLDMDPAFVKEPDSEEQTYYDLEYAWTRYIRK